jgi:putative ABC transport system permease protein
MNYVRTERLGYDREHVLVIPAREQETMQKLPALRAAFEERTEVIKAARSGSLPTRLGVRYSGMEMAKDDGTKVRLNFDIGYVDDHFLDVFKIELIAGRDFRPGDKESVLINETAARELGWKDPVGRKFLDGPKEVVGVVRDFHYGSLHNKIGPMALFYDPGGAQLSVRIRPGDLERTMGVLRSVFEENTHGQPFEFFFLDDAFNTLYKKETRTGQIFGAFAGLAILIACFGLLGLASFNVARRTKEIGVRKVLGASVARLVLLLNRDFLHLVVIANLLAWPLAYVAMNKWLEDFAYRISIRPWILLLSSLLALAVAVIVVWGQTVRAARVNPADTLRYE